MFCNILVDVIANCQKLKSFELIGYKINPDHTHLILKPTGEFNISQIMHSIKRVSSDQINQIICYKNESELYKSFKWTSRLKTYNQSFIRKNNYLQHHEFPKFKWQESFDDQLIRTPERLSKTIVYTRYQAEHHQLNENKFLFIKKKIPSDLIFIGEKKK
ncbi:MAG: transposase [Saprospiraceae bacterium]